MKERIEELKSRIKADVQTLRSLGIKLTVSIKAPTADFTLASFEDNFLTEVNDLWSGVDIPLEWKSCIAWCKANGKKHSKQRFVNWLNKAAKQLVSVGTGVPKYEAVRAFRQAASPKSAAEILRERGE
jgi:hypothetical protein